MAADDLFSPLAGLLALGTARRPLPEALGRWVDGLDALDVTDGEDEKLLLAITLLEREERLKVGHSPDTPVLASPPENLNPPPTQLAQKLDLVLGSTFPELLPEVARLLVGKQLRLPHHLLPRLLDLAAERRDAQPQLTFRYLQLGGNRAAWLAPQREEWEPLARDYDHATAFRQEKSPSGKLTALRWWRHFAPAAARKALAEDYLPQTTPTNQARLLNGLATGLSSADEPLLLEQRDARSKAVRTTATLLLSQLGTATVLEDLNALATSFLAGTPGGKRVLPPEATALLKRCGGPAAKQTLADYLLELIPPAAWRSVAGSPTAVWSHFPKNLEAIAAAVGPCGTDEDRLALLDFLIERDDKKLGGERLRRVVAPLPHDGLMLFFDDWLGRSQDLFYPEGPALRIALMSSEAWTPRVSKAVMSQLIRLAQGSAYGLGNLVHQQWRAALPLLDPTLFPWLRTQLAATAERTDAFGALALRTLQTSSFRRQLYQ